MQAVQYESISNVSRTRRKDNLCGACLRIYELLNCLGKDDYVLTERFPDGIVEEVTDDYTEGFGEDWVDQVEDIDMMAGPIDDRNSQGTSVTLFPSSNPKCSLCKTISAILTRLGLQPESTRVPFTVFPTNAVQCLRATVQNGIALYLQPNHAKAYLRDINSTALSTEFSAKSLRHCIKNHRQLCSRTRDIPNTNFVPIYLIDLQSNCLIRTSTLETFAALSYVWGPSGPTLQNDAWECSKITLPKMQEHGFFISHINRIPRTVVDAMMFTRCMGLRYLWVDRYCIVQDDRAEKHSQLQAMGSIYYHAHFVIIAAEGDGNDGLHTNESNHDKHRIPCSEVSAKIGIIYEPVTEDTRWSTRGWTFQEMIFARRSFVFRGGIATFQCQKSVWQEGTKLPISHEYSLHSSGTTNLTIHRWPNMLYFRSLLEEYIVRELTYPCDSLDAFAGILGALEASFPDGFLFGLPEVCFDISLLWQPKGVLRDRTKLADIDRKHHVDLPSWSWARWKGPFDFSAWNAAADCLFLSYYNQNFYFITQIVDWQKTSRTSGELFPIANRYGKDRILAQDRSLPLPPGWRRQALPLGIGKDCTLSRLLSSTNHKFIHSTLGKQYSFRFPIPLPVDINEGCDAQSWTSKIQGRANRAFLSVKPKERPHDENDCWYSIERQPTYGDETQVGVVRLHDPESEDWCNGKISGEFIAISMGEFLGVPGQSVGIPWTILDEWELKKRTTDGNVYQFYNVMLIERCNGVAMRKGLGRVQKALWEGLDLEKVDVVLG